MYSITKQSKGYVTEFVVDYLTDITTLPITPYAIGSTCFCIEDSSVWMLGNDRQWHQI